jgi:hypothetical protein
MSYVIPVNELSLADRKAAINNRIEDGIARGIAKLGLQRTELVVREASPLTDFPGAWATEYYVSPAIVAVGWGWAGGGAAVGVLPVGEVAVFYKGADADANPAFTACRFRVGPTGATTKATFFFQLVIDNKMESDFYLSESVIYDPQDNVFVQAYSRIAAHAAEELSFGCFIVEKLGSNVS